jgi:hypothetical protein
MLKFMPDADPSTPDALLYVSNLIPTLRGGYRTMMGANAVGTYAALGAAALGSASVEKLDSSRRLFVGTDTQLFEGVSNAWSSVSRGGNYTAGAKKWRFCQYGNVSLAANGLDKIQASTGTSFADIPTAPVAKIVENASPLFVMALDTAEHGANSWHCSAIGDYTDWTPALATSCAYGTLMDTPGGITGGKQLGENFVIYKRNAIYLGSYVAPDPVIWMFSLVPGPVGCVSHEAIVNAGDFHLIIGDGDFYLFDGTRPRPIGDGIKKWFFTNALPSRLKDTQSYHDPIEGVAYWFYVSNAGSAIDSWVAYNYKTGQWGAGSLTGVESVVNYLASAFNATDLASGIAPGYAYGTGISGGAPLNTESMRRLAFFDNTHALKELSNGNTAAGELMTSDIGDDSGAFTLLKRVTPIYHIAPASATLSAYSRPTMAPLPAIASPTATAAQNSQSRFDFMTSGRVHRVKLSLTGFAEVAKLIPIMSLQGLE